MDKRIAVRISILAAFLVVVAVARSEAQPRVFSTNNSAQTVSSIDAITGATTAAGVPQPYGVAVSPDGASLFVTARGDEQLYMLRVSDLARVKTMPSGRDPYGVAIGPDNRRAYVANGLTNALTIIDIATGAQVQQISLSASPYGVAIAPDGGRAYVTLPPADAVAVVDLRSGAVSLIPVGHTPRGVAVNADGTRVYVTNQAWNSVSIIDAAAGVVTQTVSVDSTPFGVAVTPDGRRLLVAHDIKSGSVSEIDAATGQILGRISRVGAYPMGIAVNGAGTQGYVVLSGNDALGVIDIANIRLTGTIATGRGPVLVATTPAARSSVALSVSGTGTAGATVRIAATLTASGQPVANRNIEFTYRGAAAGSAFTDATGTAAVIVPAGDLPAGTFAAAVSAAFAGDYKSAPATATGDLTLAPAVSDPPPSTSNTAPTAAQITWNAPVEPVLARTALTAQSAFSDADTTDVHTAVFAWGDGTSTAASIAETGGSGVASASHSYAAAGFYHPTVTVTDRYGASATAASDRVVVTDPLAGYETGSGMILSPPGAYSAKPDATGYLTIKQLYVRPASDGSLTDPTNSFYMSFSAGNFAFSSTSLQWLVLTGSKAWVTGKGIATADGFNEECYFLVSTVDSMTAADRVRIKIWSAVDGSVRYDNQRDATGVSAPDEADALPTVATGPGTIVFGQ